MQLNLKSFFERTETYFPRNTVTSREADGSLFRYHYADYCARTRQLASALHGEGIEPGDRIATLGWNTYRHMELYFAVPCMGAVLHTVNIRIADEHVAYIINKAADRILFVDPDLLGVLQRLAGELPSLEKIVVMGEIPDDCPLDGLVEYESFIGHGDAAYAFPDLDENSPCGMCFTSATTGLPKGVVYTQRMLYLHTLGMCAADALAIAERDTILPIVPMFHANTWGLPFAAMAVGANMVLPGPQPDAAVILDLIESEQVTFCAAAVTVGVQMHQELQQRVRDTSSLRALMLGGSATPAALMRAFAEDYGVAIYTAWGATECAPLATTTHVRRELLDAGVEARIAVRARQGIPVPGVDIEVLDEQGKPVPRDDEQAGEIYVRGPWIAESYYQDERTEEGFVDGWWKSGDIATVGEDGALRLVDRAKDLIKSGGEWISSVDIENQLMAHPDVADAAVVAAPHPRWQERPLAYVVAKAGQEPPDKEDLRDWLAEHFVKWWLPDDYIMLEALPRTGVGKVNKRDLRSLAAEHFQHNIQDDEQEVGS